MSYCDKIDSDCGRPEETDCAECIQQAGVMSPLARYSAEDDAFIASIGTPPHQITAHADTQEEAFKELGKAFDLLWDARAAELTRVQGERDGWKKATDEAWEEVHLGWKLFETEAAQYEHPFGEVFYQCPDPDGGFECSCTSENKCKLSDSACIKYFLVNPINALADAKKYSEMDSALTAAHATIASMQKDIATFRDVAKEGCDRDWLISRLCFHVQAALGEG